MKDIEKVKDKVKKLLRLSESKNENEAMLAMKKAQELLIKHKLTMADVKEKDESPVIRKQTGIYFTKYKDYWKCNLLCSLSKNYFCEVYSNHAKYDKKRQLCIVGRSSDIDILLEVYDFAAENIEGWFKEYKKENKDIDPKSLQGIKNLYGGGYAEGISDLLKQQLKDFINECSEETALALSIPKEATEFMNSLKPDSSRGKINTIEDAVYFMDGYQDGNNAQIRNKLAE